MWFDSKNMDDASRSSTKDFIEHIQSAQKQARLAYCLATKISCVQALALAPPSLTLANGYTLRKEEMSYTELEGRIVEIQAGLETFVMPILDT